MSTYAAGTYSGVEIWVLGFGFWVPGFEVPGFGVWGFGFRVSSLGRVSTRNTKTPSWVQGFGFRVSCFGLSRKG